MEIRKSLISANIQTKNIIMNKKSRPGGSGRLFAQDASVHHLEKGMFMNKVIITYPFFNVKQLERICYYEKTCRWQMAKEKSH
jgi:hypothetical protein